MPNKAYIRGRAAEYKCIKELEKEGYYAQRSAGSHSYIDVWAVDLNGFRLIQVKRQKRARNTSWAYYEPNIRLFRELRVPRNCRKEVWTWIDKKRAWRKDVFD